MSDLASLPGVGPKRAAALASAGIASLRDLIYHLPRKYLDRTRLLRVAELKPGEDAAFAAEVESVRQAPGGRLVVRVGDGTGGADLVFFRGGAFLQRRFQPGQRLLVAGVPTEFRGQRALQFAHPDLEALAPGAEAKGSILPRYPLTEEMEAARVEHKLLQRLALEALERYQFSDPVPSELRTRIALEAEAGLLRRLHRPDSLEGLEDWRRQLKWREALPLALRLEENRAARASQGRAWPRGDALAARLAAAFPFALTPGQAEVTAKIRGALSAGPRFLGLLQGDVGSGKTVVALLGAAGVLEGGGQAALMAPTEILAAQHYARLSPALEAAGAPAALLTGDTPKAERQRILAGLAAGSVRFAIGTHALLSADVAFRDLGYVAIDEQHRFGVRQREALEAKGRHPHLLHLSATPIPRSLAQSLYGDLDALILPDKPPGRLPVKTRLVPAPKRRDMLDFLAREAAGGNRVFWVVPRVGDEGGGETSLLPQGPGAEDLRGLERVAAELEARGGGWTVARVHGRMEPARREAALRDFRAGRAQVLVATTVIEVGVDIPEANIMVIENPERFGLAQLHQLRGRTGRGGGQAWCFLALPEAGLPEAALERLREFTATEDGFRIAELDLESRGAGHLEGRLQSGYGALRFLDFLLDRELFATVREAARAILAGNIPVTPGELARLRKA